LVHRQARRTCSGAFSAIDARLGISPDFDRAEEGRNSQKSAVRTQISAPEVLEEHRQQNQKRDDNGCCLPDITKEIQHFYISHQAVGRGHEVMNRLRGHGADHEDKEA
jgi:hypothetical protein